MLMMCTHQTMSVSNNRSCGSDKLTPSFFNIARPTAELGLYFYTVYKSDPIKAPL